MHLEERRTGAASPSPWNEDLHGPGHLCDGEKWLAQRARNVLSVLAVNVAYDDCQSTPDNLRGNDAQLPGGP